MRTMPSSELEGGVGRSELTSQPDIHLQGLGIRPQNHLPAGPSRLHDWLWAASDDNHVVRSAISDHGDLCTDLPLRQSRQTA